MGSAVLVTFRLSSKTNVVAEETESRRQLGFCLSGDVIMAVSMPCQARVLLQFDDPVSSFARLPTELAVVL